MIKKTFITVFLLVGLYSFAQLNKNRIMINGRGNFYTDKLENVTVNNVTLHGVEKVSEGNLNLNIGYFLSNSFAIGGILGLEKNINTRSTPYIWGSITTETTTSQNFYAGIFARYNHMIKESKFGLFFQLNNTFGAGKAANEVVLNGVPNPTTRNKNHTFKMGLTPGLMYFITNRLSIETSIGDLSYHSSVSEDIPLKRDVRHESIFNADFSMATVYFGLTFYLGGKKSEDTKIVPSESK
jgi:hypothetical protein